MFSDPRFWLAVSFVIFVLLIAKYIWPVLIKMIDGKKSQVINDILQARKLKNQAEELLEKARQYHKDSIAYSQELIADARKEAKNYIGASTAEIEEELTRKIQLAKQRIAREEENVIRAVKSKIVASAIEALEQSFADDKDKENQALKIALDKALEDVSKLVH